MMASGKTTSASHFASRMAANAFSISPGAKIGK
jgi:hypothetical protein